MVWYCAHDVLLVLLDISRLVHLRFDVVPAQSVCLAF
jgi:hypothetical protein